LWPIERDGGLLPFKELLEREKSNNCVKGIEVASLILTFFGGLHHTLSNVRGRRRYLGTAIRRLGNTTGTSGILRKRRTEKRNGI